MPWGGNAYFHQIIIQDEMSVEHKIIIPLKKLLTICKIIYFQDSTLKQHVLHLKRWKKKSDLSLHFLKQWTRQSVIILLC